MRHLIRTVYGMLCGILLLPTFTMAQELDFQGPFGITNVSRPVTVHAGDMDGDGKLDLVASNGSGVIIALFQNSENRMDWAKVPLRVGASCFFTRAGDFDNDGFADLAVADGGSVTYFVRSRGDRTFETPVPLRQARGSRWIATGDWNKDGNLDLASSNLATSTLTIFVGDGAGNFEQTGRVSSGREHTLETLDYDGDGNLDLALGTGIPGIQLHQGQGDGTFKRRHQVPGHLGLLGCVEYIAVGDFNNDGLDDLAPTCIDDQTAYAGVSLGTGRYRRILKDPFASGTESSAIGDLNGDGNDDLCLVSHGTTALRVYLGKGNGQFERIREFGSTGGKPVFLICEDLDRDGHDDVISADESSSSLTVFYGRAGEPFLQSSKTVTGYGTARDYTVGDLDGNGQPDFFYANAVEKVVNVYLNPGVETASEPSFDIEVGATLDVLEVADVNGDGTVDILGADNSTDAVHVIVLDAKGNPSQPQVLECQGNPKGVRTSHLDEGPTVDLVTLCKSADEIVTFLGNGDGTFEAGPAVPTMGSPKRFDVGDLDGDGRDDLVVAGFDDVVYHRNLDGNGFGEPVFVVQDDQLSMTLLLVGDLDGNGGADIVIGDRGKEVIVYPNTGAAEFGEPIHLELSTSPSDMTIGDMNGDSMPDLAVGYARTQAVEFFFNRGADGFSEPETHRAGAALTKLKIVDVNNDSLKDIVAFSRNSTGVGIRIGDASPAAARFIRGDADNDGKVALNDAVRVLNRLFRGAAPLACPDAGDSNDDGKLGLTDVIEVLSYLFRGGSAPADPGGESCGVDPSDDELGECSERC